MGMAMEFGEQVTVKLDSKGRLYIPTQIRKEIGETVTIKRISEGFLLVPSKKEDAAAELRKIIESKRKRTGKPEIWSPEEMKSIWGRMP
jgi:DNA-binding transcriptional regulator/RsmH inhibitor MraZ